MFYLKNNNLGIYGDDGLSDGFTILVRTVLYNANDLGGNKANAKVVTVTQIGNSLSLMATDERNILQACNTITCQGGTICYGDLRIASTLGSGCYAVTLTKVPI